MYKLIILSFIIVMMIYHASSYTTPIRIHHRKGRRHLSHSLIAVKKPMHHRHQLRSVHEAQFLVSNLTNTHIAFTLPITVAGIQYSVNVDTGSSDIWVKAQGSKGLPQEKYECHDCQHKHPTELGYLDGTLKAYLKTLPIQFAGQKFDAELFVATSGGPQFDDVQGICGLSYPQLATHRPTFIETLIEKDIIDQYAYGFVFNLIEDDKSLINFGEPDDELYEGYLSSHSILSKHGIKIRFSYARFGSGHRMRVGQALLDTGNTCISIPTRYTDHILREFNTKHNRCMFFEEQNIDTFKLLQCRIGSFDQLPVLRLRMGHKTFEIPKQYYLQNCQEFDKQYYCYTYIQTVDLAWEYDTIFLGDAFFNRFYTHFNLEEQKVRIGKNKQNITLDAILKLQDQNFDILQWLPLLF